MAATNTNDKIQLEILKLIAEVQKTVAETGKTREETEKAREETEKLKKGNRLFYWAAVGAIIVGSLTQAPNIILLLDWFKNLF